MKRLNLLVILCLILFLMSNAFALQYNYFLDNGTWSQYTSGLSSAYYATDNYFNTYDRGFESISTSNFVDSCSGEWCSSKSVIYSSPTYEVKGTGEDYSQGSQSLLLYSNVTQDQILLKTWGKEEILSDANIVFDYKYIETGNIANTIYFGYVDDENNFTSLSTLSNIANTSGWVEASIIVPSGSPKRFAIQTNMGNSASTGTGSLYIDNVRVIKNNTGTFRTTDPQYCGSLNSCSNIEEYLKSNELGGTYWVVDYVEDATCSWSKNSVDQGLMTEGSNGNYYAFINESVSSGSYVDLNLSANCLRVPFVQKNFFVSPTLNRYGLLDGGNFEDGSTTNFSGSCSDYFCSEYVHEDSSGLTPVVKGSLEQYSDGQYSLKNTLSGGGFRQGSSYIWSKEEYSGGDTIYLKYMIYSHEADYSSGSKLYFGYVNDSNVFTAVGDYIEYPSLTKKVWFDHNITIPTGNLRFAIRNQTHNADSVLYFDVISSSGKKQESSLNVSNTLTSNFGLKGTNYTFSSEYLNSGGGVITDGDCNVTISGTDYEATYNSETEKYEYETAFVSDGEYSVTHSCESESFDDQTESYSINISTPASSIIEFEAIQNISSYEISDFEPLIELNPKNSTDDIIFSVINQESAYDIVFNWFNLDKTHAKQYTIYTSTNGTDWTFSDTYTFGESSDYDDPVQKTLRENSHNYSFEATLPEVEKVYFKLVYNQLPLAYQTIANSTDWVNINQPVVYTDENNYKWDLYADSNYTPIYSYTSKRFPDLTSSDLNTGFELQFTAYATTDTNLSVGYVIGTTTTTENVPITTTQTRYSVPIDPTSDEARLFIGGLGTINSEIYITDYAIVPKAYFTNRLNVYNRDGTTLNAIINEGVSQTYLREGIPFKIETSAYDKDGDLKRLNVQAVIGGITIKSQDFYLKDATEKDKVFTWFETINGFVDLDGTYVNPVGMRDIQIKATLYNTSNESVSEQTSTYKILQYPYFQNDLVFNLYSINAKVGESPKVRFNLRQQDPSQFVGFKVFIYDSDNSLSDPDYETTILNDKLNCNSFECQKELEFTEYVYDQNGNYRIDFLILLKTEEESYDNPLTLKAYNQLVTYREFETARVFQVFERTDRTYRNDEKIQLVVQLRDEPYKNLLDDTSVYLNVDLCNNETIGTGNCYGLGTTKFYPKSKIYDETTGYNYFFFDQLFYDDSGNLLPDGNYVRFRANITDERYSHRIADIPTATLGDKCATGYGTLFNYGIFTMNFWENLWTSSERALYGCSTFSSPTITLHESEEKRLLIDVDHNVGSGQNHSIACLKVDNENFQNTLEQDLVCAVFWNRNEQPIDKFVVTMGNEFSDYAKSGAETQYLKFDIPAEQLIFNDAFMLAQSLNAEYQTDSLDTIGEITFYGFDKLFSGIANPLVAIPEGLTRTGMITNIGFDINFSNALDPTYVKGLFFFKIKGLKVINQFDYINQYPQLETLSPKYFRKFANDNDIRLPIDETLVNIYTNDLSAGSIVGEQLDALKVQSPLIIFAEKSKQQGADGNFENSITTLRFNLISDMLSNNQTQTQRNFIPFVFSYVVPAKTGVFAVIEDILYGTDQAGNDAGLFTNPVGFGFKNWFWFVIIIVFLLIGSLILKNLRANGGGGTAIPVVTPFLENMHTNKTFGKRGR